MGSPIGADDVTRHGTRIRVEREMPFFEREYAVYGAQSISHCEGDLGLAGSKPTESSSALQIDASGHKARKAPSSEAAAGFLSRKKRPPEIKTASMSRDARIAQLPREPPERIETQPDSEPKLPTRGLAVLNCIPTST